MPSREHGLAPARGRRGREAHGAAERPHPIHQPSGGYQGQASDIEIHAREALELRGHVDAIYARHTGQTVEWVHDDMDRDRYFTAEQSVEYGLVDRVIASHEVSRAALGFRGEG